MWCLKMVQNHTSLKSAEEFLDIFMCMFPDAMVVQKDLEKSGKFIWKVATLCIYCITVCQSALGLVIIITFGHVSVIKNLIPKTCMLNDKISS